MNIARAFERKLKCSQGMLTTQDNISRTFRNCAISNEKGNLPQVLNDKALPIPKIALCNRINRGIRELLIMWAQSTPDDET